MEKTFRYRIYPNKTQCRLLAGIFGCSRFVFNYYRHRRKEMYETNGLTMSYVDCVKDLTGLKEEHSWLKETDSRALQNSYDLICISTVGTTGSNACGDGVRRKSLCCAQSSAKQESRDFQSWEVQYSLVIMHVSRNYVHLASGLTKTASIVNSGTLPLLYAGAMLVDAVAAFNFGLMYDKKEREGRQGKG